MPNILRPKAAWQKLGVGRTTFYEEFVAKGRVRLVPLGERARGVIDDELDALIEDLRAKRDKDLRKAKAAVASSLNTA
jgi:hypothetical protein